MLSIAVKCTIALILNITILRNAERWKIKPKNMDKSKHLNLGIKIKKADCCFHQFVGIWLLLRGLELPESLQTVQKCLYKTSKNQNLSNIIHACSLTDRRGGTEDWFSKKRGYKNTNFTVSLTWWNATKNLFLDFCCTCSSKICFHETLPAPKVLIKCQGFGIHSCPKYLYLFLQQIGKIHHRFV